MLKCRISLTLHQKLQNSRPFSSFQWHHRWWKRKWGEQIAGRKVKVILFLGIQGANEAADVMLTGSGPLLRSEHSSAGEKETKWSLRSIKPTPLLIPNVNNLLNALLTLCMVKQSKCGRGSDDKSQSSSGIKNVLQSVVAELSWPSFTSFCLVHFSSVCYTVL